MNKGIMLNDSIVNFYLNYSFNQHVNDSLNRCGIRPEEAVQVLNGEFSGEEDQKEAIGRCLNSVLLKYYIFSSFFYPQLIALRKLGNEKAKKKVLKWAEDGHILEREFVFFPIFEQYVCPLCLIHSSHFSLALLCYPNTLKKYVTEKQTINGVNFKTGKPAKTSSVGKLVTESNACQK